MKIESYEEFLRDIDAQITDRQSKPEPGDRRRNQGSPPQGTAERRSGIERRSDRNKSDVLSRDLK